MNLADFLIFGYQQYPINPLLRHADLFLQKRIYDVIGTKYYINAYGYILKSEETFEFEVQFKKNNLVYNISILQATSIQEAEVNLENLWGKMTFNYHDSIGV